jgi:hypothetical protein
MASASVYVEASCLANHPKVAPGIEDLRVEKERERRKTRTEREAFILGQLEELALTASTGHVRIRALELLGRYCGMFSLDDKPKNLKALSAEDLGREIKDKLAQHLSI